MQCITTAKQPQMMRQRLNDECKADVIYRMMKLNMSFKDTALYAKKLNWLWQDEHEIEWIETFVKIIDKSGKTVPFKLTPEQKAFINGRLIRM